MADKFFYKKAAYGAIKNEIMSNKELAEELHKPTIIKFKKSKNIPIIYRQYLRC